MVRWDFVTTSKPMAREGCNCGVSPFLEDTY